MTSTTIKEYLSRFHGKVLSLVGPFSPKKSFQDPVIFVDRGINARTDKLGIAVGDGDSSSEDEMDVLWPSRKDYSDLEGVLKEIPEEFSKIRLYGFLEGRKDHEFSNFISLYNFLYNRNTPCLIDLEGEVYLIHKTFFSLDFKGEFSLFSFHESKIKIKGDVEFPFEGILRPMSAQGLSNNSYNNLLVESEATVFLFCNQRLY